MNPVLLQAKSITPPTALGWTFMIVSVAFVVLLTFWCFYKVLTVPHPEDEARPPAGFGP